MFPKTFHYLKIIFLIESFVLNCFSFDQIKGDEVEGKEWLKSWAHLTKYSHSDYDSSLNSVYNLDYNNYPEDPDSVPQPDPEPRTNTSDEDYFQKNFNQDFYHNEYENENEVIKSEDANQSQSQYFSKNNDWEYEEDVHNTRKQKRPGFLFFICFHSH